MQYPPDDPAQARADAAARVARRPARRPDANERLQFAAAFVLDAFGDSTDAETIRMLPVGGGARPGKPAVPPPAARSERLTDARRRPAGRPRPEAARALTPRFRHG
jgi:hypothetical protein